MKETEQIHDSIRKQMTDVVPAALAKIQVLVGQLEELKAKNKQLEVQLLGLRQENTDLKNFRGEI